MSQATAFAGAETGVPARITRPLIEFAHPDYLTDASPALAAPELCRALTASPRVSGRLEMLLANRLAADTRVGDIDLSTVPADVSAGFAFLDAREADLERRLLFLGVVSYGPALRRSVLRDEVAVLVDAIGSRMLRAALARAELGVDRLGLDLSSADNALFCFEQRAAEHFAAWLNRLPPAIATRAQLALSPLSPFSPMRPEYGDPTLLPALAPLAATIDAEASA